VKDIDQVRQNLFPAAHESIWRAFPWHSGAHQPHSSQVLAIDVFGTVQNHPLCDSLVSELVMTVFGAQMSDIAQQGWTVKLEFRVPSDLFGEPRPTQLDVLLENNTAVVVLECKFTETGDGPCSQPPEQCNGRYEMQTNPKNDKRARCALTGKGVEYWRWIPRYFALNSAQSYALLRALPISTCAIYSWRAEWLVGINDAVPLVLSTQKVSVFRWLLRLPTPIVSGGDSRIYSGLTARCQWGPYHTRHCWNCGVRRILQILLWINLQSGSIKKLNGLKERLPFLNELDRTLDLLTRRELIEPADGGYRFQVELIRRWFAQR